ncbi:MAG: hypothetical protein RIQ93_325 [Verrucomicrobiota bacterium]|jgi:hypothetical protein
MKKIEELWDVWTFRFSDRDKSIDKKDVIARCSRLGPLVHEKLKGIPKPLSPRLSVAHWEMLRDYWRIPEIVQISVKSGEIDSERAAEVKKVGLFKYAVTVSDKIPFQDQFYIGCVAHEFAHIVLDCWGGEYALEKQSERDVDIASILLGSGYLQLLGARGDKSFSERVGYLSLYEKALAQIYHHEACTEPHSLYIDDLPLPGRAAMRRVAFWK